MDVQVAREDHGQVPRGALRAACALVVIALGLSTLTRLTDVGATRVAPVPVVSSVQVRFADESDGSVTVTRATDGKVIGTLPPSTNGFARSTVRGLVRERRRSSIGAQPPFTLTRWADGRLSLSDASTGRKIELDVFGPSNAAVFATLLTAGTT